MDKIAYVLIDFDNIEKSLRINNQGLENRLYRIVTANKYYKKINFRFYGGWDYQKRTSYSALALLPWIHSYPHLINKTILNAELVRSLAFETNTLPFTFRRRSKNYVFNVDPSKICRNDSTCELFMLHSILSNHKCCNKDLFGAFLFNEQKLVDSMISTDLLYLSSLKSTDLYLVSSDDDFIPTIRYLCFLGNSVSIIHTLSSYLIKKEYKTGYHSQIHEMRV